jgi:hypothetical protein
MWLEASIVSSKCGIVDRSEHKILNRPEAVSEVPDPVHRHPEQCQAVEEVVVADHPVVVAAAVAAVLVEDNN